MLYAHCSEGHGESGFTNYDAVKKSIELFDKLLMKKENTKVRILKANKNRQNKFLWKGYEDERSGWRI